MNNYITVCYECRNGHSNESERQYDPYYGTVLDVVNDYIFDPMYIANTPCTICREVGFFNVSYIFNSRRFFIFEQMDTGV